MSLTHKHFILNKPYGYISQFMSNAPKSYKKKFLGELFPFPNGVMPVGRLDEKSEGLLLLTTDGRLCDYLLRAKVEKEYYVQLDGLITAAAIEKLKLGVEIGLHGKKYKTKPSQVCEIEIPNLHERQRKIRDDRHGPTSWISIILREGKNRQVRKMTAAVGYPTLRLVRIRVGKIELGDLKIGTARELSTLV